MDKHYVFDVEANGYLYDATQIHCIVIQQVHPDTRKPIGPWKCYIGAALDEAVAILSNADLLIGHNITGYDLPLFNKLYPGLFSRLLSYNIYDTFLASQMKFPNATWGHSIEAWGKKLGYPEEKVPITDWSRLTLDMERRCIIDVGINNHLYMEMAKHEWGSAWKNNMVLECTVALIHARQELEGVRYDAVAAHKLAGELEAIRLELRSKLIAGVPPKIKKWGVTVMEPFTKAGSFKKMTVDALKDHVLLSTKGTPLYVKPSAVGPFNRIEYVPFNPDSPSQVVEYLLSVGWKPTEWNFVREPDGSVRKTTPKITEDSWDTLPAGFGKMIGEYRMVSHRRRLIVNDKDPSKGALATIREDGRVPAEAMTCATPTARYRHMRTVCNIPRPSSPYGKEIRSLFICSLGSMLCGLDLSGIEARMLAHYIMEYEGGPELAKIITEGDYHSYNAKNWGVTRDQAKSGLYALMYGCGPAKLASTLGKPMHMGRRLFNLFWKANKPIKTLIENLELAYDKKKPIKLLDGRVVDIRQKRLLLNTLLQGSAAVIFKAWMCLCDKYLSSLRGTASLFRQVIAYHDELQYEVYNYMPDLAKSRAAKLCELAGEAGVLFDVKVPIKAEYKIGHNWAETH